MADSRLTYYLPRPRKPHTALQVPGAHTLYVGPSSCMRRHDMHARQYGNRRAVSFLHITEADVISGCYEQLVVENIGTLLHVLDPTPHIFQIAVFCIDDFLGTDEEALLANLEDMYPDCQFAIDHIDPVSLDGTASMGARKYSNLYSFIKAPGQRDRGVNFIGNFASLDPACDFLEMLGECDAGPVRELFTCETYEEYQAMGSSCLNVVMRLMALRAAQDMEERLGIPYYVFAPSIDARRVAQGYGDVADMLGSVHRDFGCDVERVREHADCVVRALGGMPVAIDALATLTPFSVAKALIGYGFTVRWVFRSNHRFKLDPEAEDHIVRECPFVNVARAEDFSSVREDVSAGECLAIGLDGARVLRARHVVDMWHDEGYFGFQGIHRLLDEMQAAACGEYDWDASPVSQGRSRF